MNKQEYLLTCLIEEASEVSQAICHSQSTLSINESGLHAEIVDLIAVWQMLFDASSKEHQAIISSTSSDRVKDMSGGLINHLLKTTQKIIQAACKSQRFGLDSRYGEYSNIEYLADYIADFFFVWQQFSEQIGFETAFDEAAIEQKKAKVEKFMGYSVECGCLEGVQ